MHPEREAPRPQAAVPGPAAPKWLHEDDRYRKARRLVMLVFEATAAPGESGRFRPSEVANAVRALRRAAVATGSKVILAFEGRPEPLEPELGELATALERAVSEGWLDRGAARELSSIRSELTCA